MGSPCKLPRPSGALPPGLGGFRSATAGGSTGRGVTVGRGAEQETGGPRRPGYAVGSAGPKGEGAARAPQPGTARRQRDWASPCPRRPAAGAPRPPSPGRGSPLRALRQMLHNADPLPSAKWPGPHAAQESGSGAQGSDAERDGPGMGGSRIPDVVGRERGVEMLSRRLPTPPETHTRPQPAHRLEGLPADQVTILQIVQSSLWAGEIE